MNIELSTHGFIDRIVAGVQLQGFPKVEQRTARLIVIGQTLFILFDVPVHTLYMQ